MDFQKIPLTIMSTVGEQHCVFKLPQIIVGPTASGKSSLAMELAQQDCGEVINLELYKDLCILSACPTTEDTLSIPHHMYGVMDSNTVSTAAIWAQEAFWHVQNIWQSGITLSLLAGLDFT